MRVPHTIIFRSRFNACLTLVTACRYAPSRHTLRPGLCSQTYGGGPGTARRDTSSRPTLRPGLCSQTYEGGPGTYSVSVRGLVGSRKQCHHFGTRMVAKPSVDELRCFCVLSPAGSLDRSHGRYRCLCKHPGAGGQNADVWASGRHAARSVGAVPLRAHGRGGARGGPQRLGQRA
jgi:hypothetical protein